MAKRLRKHAKRGTWIPSVIALIVVVVLVVGFVWSQTNYMLVREIKYSNTLIPRQYSGYKIAHISNIDNERQHLASTIKSYEPDLIVVSGGLVDEKGGYDNTVKELNELNNIASTLFVAQEQDLDYISSIASETDAIYANDRSFSLPEVELSALDYLKLNGNKDMIKQVEAGTDEANAYIEFLEASLEESKGQTIQIMGVNGLNDNIYDTKDEIFDIKDFNASYRMILFGNYKAIDGLADAGINLMFVGGTYGLKNDTEYVDGETTVNDYDVFISPGVCSDLPSEKDTKRFMNFTEIQMITLSDGMITDRNPLEKFLDKFVKDTGTIFDDDGGFQEYTYEYGGLK